MSQGDVNARDILEQLTVHHSPLRWSPIGPADQLTTWDEKPVGSEPSLQYLHEHYQLPNRVEELGIGQGVSGRLGRLFARLSLRVMRRRLEHEQDLLAHFVQITQILARRVDELSTVVAAHQVAEAANQARLAGWLEAALPHAPGSGQ
jgi:hypothetical protein